MVLATANRLLSNESPDNSTMDTTTIDTICPTPATSSSMSEAPHIVPNLEPDYAWYVTRSDISPILLQQLAVDNTWKTDETHPEEKYTLFLTRSLFSDHKARWVAEPAFCLPDESPRFPEVQLPGKVVQELVMSVLQNGGEVYDDGDSVFC